MDDVTAHMQASLDAHHDGEPADAHALFMAYVAQDEDERSLATLATATGTALDDLTAHAGRYDWQARAYRYDAARLITACLARQHLYRLILDRAALLDASTDVDELVQVLDALDRMVDRTRTPADADDDLTGVTACALQDTGTTPAAAPRALSCVRPAPLAEAAAATDAQD